MKVNHLDVDFVLPVQSEVPRATRIYCEEEIKDQPTGWRQRRGYGNNCQRHAVYDIGSKKLCRLHAGTYLLDELFKAHPDYFYRKSNTPSLQRKP